jgi:serine/threonine protein phosphatase PrpC
MRRRNNEDRIHVDVAGGLFVVVDGVGGQAAGERAADIAMTAVRTGVGSNTGPADERLRSAIVSANNEIVRQAQGNPDLAGMGCVLTAVVLDGAAAVVGHVGDTRLYKFRQGSAIKITHDHSPVGEQEERGELSEAEAMRHPMRNQVYRALGGEAHSVSDDDFVEIQRVSFEDDSALLMCSDGLTDLVPLGEISYLVDLHAHDPQAVVERLIDAANKAGGKDNVSAIFLAAARFAEESSEPDTTITRKIHPNRRKPGRAPSKSAPSSETLGFFVRGGRRSSLIFLGGALAGAAAAGGFFAYCRGIH